MWFVAGHQYTLPELIDIAQRHHPETREAWEKARQAALAVGIAEATYLPRALREGHRGLSVYADTHPERAWCRPGVFEFSTVEAIPTAGGEMAAVRLRPA